MIRDATRSGLCIGLGVVMALLSGCSTAPKQTDPDKVSVDSIVVSQRRDPDTETMVRVYSLRGVGLKDAPAEEVQAFMDTLRSMVVTSQWDRTNSTIQVFGVLMTVRTTPDNHLLIEHYLNQVRQVMGEHPLAVGATVR